MQRLLAILSFTACLYGGVIQGVVLDHASGRPLARSVVRLDSVPSSGGKAGQPLITRAGRSGQFVFPAVNPGTYLLTASRDTYFPSGWGQRLPGGRGTPIAVTSDSTLFAELRLRHKGAITGRVLDENGVPAPGVPVVAYRARLPMRSAGHGISDDRGVYRIHGLEPGKYWVRSGAHTLEDGSGWLPTFGPQGREIREARVHQVTVDSEAAYADISPESGVLFRLAGLITCELAGPVSVILSSEAGQRSAQTFCGPGPGSYKFDALAPGMYEILATSPEGGASGFIEVQLGRNTEGANISMTGSRPVEIDIRRSGAGGMADIPIRLSGRRLNLAETDLPHEITGRRTTLSAGYWEFRAQAPPGSYVESIASNQGGLRRSRKAEEMSEWFAVFIEPRMLTRLQITVSDRTGQITGRVVAGGKPVAGAPVFLLPGTAAMRRSTGGALEMLSDTDGQFRFDSLPPGDYRLLASFDVSEIDEEMAELSNAPVVHLDPSKIASVDAALWVAP